MQTAISDPRVPLRTGRRPVVAFGPEMPEWGAWQCAAEDTARMLAGRFTTVRYGWSAVPPCDVLFVVKHVPPRDFLERVPRRTAIVYCPVDFFTDEAHIAAEALFLKRCSRIVIHCERLRPYLAPYAPVEYVDHPLTFITAQQVPFRTAGCVLWVGARTERPHLVEWVRENPLPARLHVLTNLEDGGPATAAEWGFQAGQHVVIEAWNPKRQRDLVRIAKAAIDIQGGDFRQQHTPPAKGLDFIASGLPLAVDPANSAAEHLARLGFQVAYPWDTRHWFSRAYWKETRRFGQALRELLGPRRIALRYERLIHEVLAGRPTAHRAASGSANASEGDRADCPEPVRARPGTEPHSPDPQARYEEASRLAEQGDYGQARTLYEDLRRSTDDARLQALVQNDLAVLAAAEGKAEEARAGFHGALATDSACAVATSNLAVLEHSDESDGLAPKPGPQQEPPAVPCHSPPPVKVAILSFLFNWPSTGGGIVHTFELGRFLARAGYQVKHVYARFDPWKVGQVHGALPFPSTELVFDESAWNVRDIQDRFREAVRSFDPDHVIITDSWNFKPRLAEAIGDYPYILRFQALECLCPLNNVRLLPAPGGGLRQCEANQLANPDLCRECLAALGQRSGGLHQAERALSGVGTAEYDRLLREAYRRAEAVFVVNPPTAEMVAPFARKVVVSPAGMDPARFPWPWPEEPSELRTPGRAMIFFAGLVQETIKGYHVLHEACRLLWQKRQDFELAATADPPGRVDDFTRYVGWQSQEKLPRYIRAADLCAVPAVAQEALGRTAVEAMAVGRPVVASRLGGLPFTIQDGVTGLLCEAGNPHDLAAKMERLLDDPGLRERMGLAGRQRFEEFFRWDAVIERDYRPLLQPRARNVPRA